ncbi:M23 family metallopeptidase [Synoicihabitans lomoniglobus]|uniref:M23 family metallopeptidase n=1 Tax=Synoicihabitans lomoniglobus TaxID=2909285 RepID=A0AAF0CQV8_9BACT|nr:M23 family metallopeptidase [Opitutaceae bacterium LMO-M01]WED66415.1 M23 family metallopeptidase [Opitutaceae bacterium LMO-M01]
MRLLLPVWFSLFLVGLASGQDDARMKLSWPTTNYAYARGERIENFIQPTVSGLATSGLFGCVRSSGTQFHEALDLMPIERDRRGEPTDEVHVVLDGVVRHVNARAGASSYGRYVVVEHVDAEPAIYTLYAHLASIDPAVVVGSTVERSQVLGIMGRSAGGYTIPKERAHVHFEMGLRLTDNFQSWYDWKKFGSKNTHGAYNGMNLVGFDPLAFYDAFRAQKVDTFADFLRGLEPVAIVRIATTKTPDFVKRYPSLVGATVPAGDLAGWEISFNQHGVPFAWRALRKAAVKDYKRLESRVVWRDSDALRACRCKDLVRKRWGHYRPDSDMQRNLQLLLGLRR